MSAEQLQTVEYLETQQSQIVHTVKPTSIIPLSIIFPQVFPLIQHQSFGIVSHYPQYSLKDNL
jgi:hypothetical protein